MVVVALCLALIAAEPTAEGEAEPAFVEILQSVGAVDGPSEVGLPVPRWEHVRLELRVKNRLTAEVRDLEVDVALLSSPGARASEASPIPGWSFTETFADEVVPPLDEAYLRIVRELPTRRTSPPAEEIAYRAAIKSYRMASPDVETAIQLLGSSHPSDQLAALKSYEATNTTDKASVLGLGRQLSATIAELGDEPSASDALRMLFAVRALGTLEDASQIATLLALPDERDGRVWGRAVIDLATRMIGASEADEPRLRILPVWARDRSLVAVRAQDTLEDAVRDAVLRMGDAAVPGLLAEARLGKKLEVRARAQRLLHALGRATVRSQLALRDPTARLDVVAVLGKIGSPEAVPALADILRTRDPALKAAAHEALLAIGPAAVGPLVSALGSKHDRPILDVLAGLGPKAHAAIIEAAARYGVTPEPGESPSRLVLRLEEHLFAAQRARLVQELETGLEEGREGAYTEAFERLDRVFAQDADLYMTYARPIAELYLARGRRLHARGDFDAAVNTLRVGQSIARLEEAEALLVEAHVALARGYVELGDLEKAEVTLREVDPELERPETRALEARLLFLRANLALDQGEYARARALIDRATALHLDDESLHHAHRRLLLAENLAIVFVLALFVLALATAIAIRLWRRGDAARLERAARALDVEGPSEK